MTKSLSMTRYALVFSLLALVVLLPDMASAGAESFENGICTVVNLISGRIGRALATVAIIFLGIGAFFGKVNWGLAIIVTVGIVAIFGAVSLAGAISNSAGGTASGCK